MPPVKPSPWSEIHDALAYGPAAPQNPGNPTDPYTQSVEWDAHVKTGISEDCLRLNVWTPGLNDGGKRPVFFYIHGGGFTSGSGGFPFDGDPLARLGDLVVVTVNHRLGPLGYLDLGALGESAKFAKAGVVGMLDLVAALEWVRDNIARFGGDPGNVTIAGQSGGGSKVSVLLVMPSAKGLFHKAVVQSGSTLTLRSREQSREGPAALIKELGVTASNLESLQNVPWSTILQAASNAGSGPIVDGTVIPKHPFDPAAPEITAPLLAACRGDEPASGEAAVTRLPGLLVARYLGDSSEAAMQYFSQLWQRLRPALTGREAQEPRIWRT
jgi:para-nitrobenzyl esterase